MKQHAKLILLVLLFYSCDMRSYLDHYHEGLTHYNNHEYKLAIISYSYSIQLNPDFAPAYKARAEASVEEFESEMQQMDYAKAIELVPGYADAYFSRGVSKFNKKKPLEAIGDFNKAIDVFNESKLPTRKVSLDNSNFSIARIYDYKASAKINLADNLGAIVDISSAIDLEPTNWNYYHHRGDVFLLLGDYKLALHDLEKAVHLSDSIKGLHQNSSDLSKMYNSLGKAHKNLGLSEQALVDFTKSIELAPKSADNYYERALLYLKLKSGLDACLDFSKAGELGHEHAYEKIREFCSPDSMKSLASRSFE